MKIMDLIALCHFGLESVTRREIEDLGYDVTEVSDGRVVFEADFDGLCRANMFLRTAERIMVRMGEFQAWTFEDLFDRIRRLPWEDFIPPKGAFPVVKATSVRSKLFSTRDIQAIAKKAVATRLCMRYGVNQMEESGETYPIRISLLKDKVTVAIDTSGESLHKRGYRRYVSKAPLSETLAAAIIQLTPYHADRILIDPFCGSGTIPIEAAMMAKNIAPGMKRTFPSMQWNHLISKKEWLLIREEAYDEIRDDVEINIQAYDADFRILRAARANAQAAGVDDVIHFQERRFEDFATPKKYGFVVTNPPYGIRMKDDEATWALYREIGEKIRGNETWSFYLLSGFEKAQQAIGRKADRNRKIYNGMLKTYLYQYMGKKPGGTHEKNRRRNEQ